MWSRIQPVGRHLTSHRVLGITAAAATITAITYHTTSQTPISTAATTTTTSPSTSTSRKPTSVIIGAGIVGLTTAYELAKSGHHVIVIDERSGPALASSYKNGSLICPSLLQPWANQGVMKKFVKSLWDDQPAMKLRFASIIDPSFWRWSYHFLSNCNSKRQHINAQALLSLSSFSAKCMKEMMADTHINFHMTSHGSLQLAPNVEALSALSASAIPIQKQGLSCDILSTSQHVHTLEPAISTSTNPLAGGVFSSMDTSGDMRTCALGLQEICQLRYASEFIYNDGMSHFITSTSTSTSTSSTTTTSHGMQLRSGRQIYADHIIITVGNWTTKMISQLGKYVPVYPVKGYVVEVPLLPNHPGPHVNLVDDANKLYIAPLHHPHQHLIRISGMAEFAGWQNIGTVVDIKRPQYLLHQTISWLPNQLDVKNASFYSCSRPVSPDDLPYIGHVTSNIYINSGHGSKGWTLCFGSARLLAEMITSKNTSIDMKPYDPLRFN